MTDEIVAEKSSSVAAAETAGERVVIQVKEEEESNEALPVTVKEEEDSDAAALRTGEVMQVLGKREEPDEEFQFPTQHNEERRG